MSDKTIQKIRQSVAYTLKKLKKKIKKPLSLSDQYSFLPSFLLSFILWLRPAQDQFCRPGGTSCRGDPDKDRHLSHWSMQGTTQAQSSTTEGVLQPGHRLQTVTWRVYTVTLYCCCLNEWTAVSDTITVCVAYLDQYSTPSPELLQKISI